MLHHKLVLIHVFSFMSAHVIDVALNVDVVFGTAAEYYTAIYPKRRRKRRRRQFPILIPSHAENIPNY